MERTKQRDATRHLEPRNRRSERQSSVFGDSSPNRNRGSTILSAIIKRRACFTTRRYAARVRRSSFEGILVTPYSERISVSGMSRKNETRPISFRSNYERSPRVDNRGDDERLRTGNARIWKYVLYGRSVIRLTLALNTAVEINTFRAPRKIFIRWTAGHVYYARDKV